MEQNDEIIDSGVIEVFNFLVGDSCKLASYAIRESYAYFTDYAINGLDNENDKSIMLAYYIVNCPDFDIPLHLSRFGLDEKIFNGKICGVSLASFAMLLRKNDFLDVFLDMGVAPPEVKPVDVEIINALRTAFIQQYKKYNNHSEYLKLLKEYTLKDIRFTIDLDVVCSRQIR